MKTVFFAAEVPDDWPDCDGCGVGENGEYDGVNKCADCRYTYCDDDRGNCREGRCEGLCALELIDPLDQPAAGPWRTDEPHMVEGQEILIWSVIGVIHATWNNAHGWWDCRSGIALPGSFKFWAEINTPEVGK